MNQSRLLLFYLHLLEKADNYEEAFEILRCASRDPDLEACDFYPLQYRFNSIYF